MSAPIYRRIWRVELLPNPPAFADDDRRLTASLEATFDEATRRAGDWLACRVGCTECCIGPFPITQLDGWRLRRGLEALAGQDAARGVAVVERAREQVRMMAPEFPGDPVTGLIDDEDGGAAAARFARRFAPRPCPALDPATGRCEVYEWRPVSCRTYGPPARIGRDLLPPCRLCFAGAPADTIDACRVSPDAEHLEDRILDGLELAGLIHRQTIVAFALVPGDEQA